MQKGNWGLVTNAAARTREGITNRQALIQEGWQLTCLFSPEHGLSAMGADGQAQAHHQDQETGLPVYSLYGPQFGPTLRMLESLDGLLFDLPDVGVRFYTYVWTLSYLMEACLEAEKSLVILDRPNPLSGQLALAEGPMLDETQWSSFIGRWSIPVRHSLTLGELARYWQQEKNMQQLELSVIACQGWQRWQYQTDTELPFIPPSPAINHPETLLTYPALCFMEGVNVNEGRGTPFPFQQFGAPWLNGQQFAQILNGFGFTGVHFESCRFRPQTNRYVGQDCQGVRLVGITPSDYRPVQTGIGILALLRLHYPEAAQWATYPTHANPLGTHHLDLLLGNSAIRLLLAQNPEQVLANLSTLTIAPDWEPRVAPFLIYADS
ncbi:MAG: hypothetical protein DHS20C18_25440 [Saprospiraceae bacterium]|nr:MAG: hypothetical protein DHS20C18_25440 [Saprospiraceae bacterium]